MRFLKNKILKAQQALEKRLQNTTEETESQDSPYESQKYEEQDKVSNVERSTTQNKDRTKEEFSSMKNIVVNYAQAIASFAISNLAVPYLESRLERENLSLKEFVNFVKREKAKMGGVSSFRARLLVKQTDTAKVAQCKRFFQWIGEIFIKYFSVNWIIHGKVTHKEIYLKFRYKMLRRIQNPESFTSIKEKKLNNNRLGS